MTRDTLLNEEIHDRTDVKRTFKEIREALEKAASREDLTELYKQTVYMILMTHSTPLNEKDRDMKRRRQTTEEEFARTVRLINQQAKKLVWKPITMRIGRTCRRTATKQRVITFWRPIRQLESPINRFCVRRKRRASPLTGSFRFSN